MIFYILFLSVALLGYRLCASPVQAMNLGLFRPMRLLFTLWVCALSLSYLGFFQLIKLVDIFSPIDFRLAFEIEIVAVIGVVVGFNVSQNTLNTLRPWSLNKGENAPIATNLPLLETITTIFTFGCAAAIILLFMRTGIVPMLAEGSRDDLRFQMASSAGSGLFTRFIYISPLVIAIKMTCMKLSPKETLKIPRFVDYLGLCILFVGLLLYGSKMLYVAPIIIFVMNYNFFVQRFRVTARWIGLGILSIILLTLLTNLRGGQKAILIDPVSDLFVVYPEFRDMAKTVNIATSQHLYIHSYWVLGVSAIPREFYDMIGAIKPDSRVQETANFAKQLLGYNFDGGSVRIGIFGELFLNSRWIGVFLGSTVLGAIFAFLEGMLAESKPYDFKVIIANALAFRISWLVLADLSTSAGILYLDIYFLLFVYFLVCARHQRSAPINGSERALIDP